MRLVTAVSAATVMAVLFAVPLFAAEPAAGLLVLKHPVQDKDFYLLSVMEDDAAARTAIDSDTQIAQIAAERRNALAAAQKSCKQEPVCEVKALLWTQEEVRAVSLALDRLGSDNAAVRSMVDREVRPAGTYALFAKLPPGALLANAWEVCAEGLNDVLSVYGEGLPPRYPAIDSISIDVKSEEFKRPVLALLGEASASEAGAPFFAPSLRLALELLALNHRDEAGRHEPMEAGVNAEPLRAIRTTRWESYPYTVIVVPGAGPSDRDTALSDAGRKRCAAAAAAWHAHKAPFVLLSGGYVHPSQTRFAEALEMKKAMIAEFNIPAAAILVDPHARHTTTNMRNAAREIFRYGIPAQKPALVVGDAAQNAYIAGQTFADRCLRELGYLPYRIVRKNNDNEIVFVPLIESLQQDPMDPLDP